VKVRAAAATRRGAGRAVNQDAVAIAGWLSQAPTGPVLALEADTDADGSLACVVADGLGGHRAGEVASLLAAGEVTAKAKRFATPEQAVVMLRQLSALIAEVGARSVHTSGMRTTVVGLVAASDRVVGFSVGDSRMFDVIGGLLYEIGSPDRAELASAAGNSLTQCLGSANGVHPHVWSLPLDQPRRYVLCSDGISDYADRQALERGVAGCTDPAKVARALLDEAVAGGTLDDASVVVVDIAPAGPRAEGSHGGTAGDDGPGRPRTGRGKEKTDDRPS
jgi:serine/threonine protein phosphatase PrpC